MIFFLLRRLSPRARWITGLVLLVAGLVVLGLSAVVGGLLIHGIILTVIGVAMSVNGRRAERAAAEQAAADGRLTGEGATVAKGSDA
jgi:predicted benzoate:H+ symporter BenE